jgi:hypothetical protein
LLVHARRITELADLAARLSLAPDDHRGVWVQLAFDAGAALVVLAVATALAVYKPRGLTRHGRRTERGSPTALRWTRADR